MGEARDLLRLQEIDLELMRSKSHLEKLPEKERITKLRAASRKVTSELNHLVGQRKDLEMSLQENSEEREKVSSMVDEAQAKVASGEVDFRAIKDLEGQLTTLAKRLEKLDFEREQIEGKVVDLASREDEHTRWLERSKEEEQKALASYKNEIAQVGARVRELNEEREEVASELDAATYERYQAASKRFGGLAVERLAGDTPSICRVSLQPSQYAKIRSATGFVECPYCHRILVVSDD